MMLPATVLLSFQHVTLVRGLKVLVQALRFEVRAGEAWALRGPNGAGKTSVLRAAAGLLLPFAGQVHHFCEIKCEPEGAAVKTEKQFGNTADRPFALRYLGHGLALKGSLEVRTLLPKAVRTAWQIDDLATLPVRFLSAGQKKRVALAQRCQPKSRLWLLDEPFANLDPEGRALFSRHLQTHLAAGGAALCSVHMDAWSGPTLTLDGAGGYDFK